jgi:deoxyribodipyrimidine photolyase-related protein
MPTPPRPVRTLVVVFGDQLDPASPALEGFDPTLDLIWMAEVAAESTHVWSHRQRIALFLSAMRHFRDAQRARGRMIHYVELSDPGNPGDLATALASSLATLKPATVACVQPGELRVLTLLSIACQEADTPLQIIPDSHFFSSPEDFKNHAKGRKSLRMEFFYREMRRRHQVLLDPEGAPEGGTWNFDHDNRKSFGKNGPQFEHPPLRFPPDELTRNVIAEVAEHFPDHPGDLADFAWPVTPDQARAALDDFIAHRLPTFGDHQDAMWTDKPFLSHSLISPALNLKLIDPRTVVEAAEQAYRDGRAPLAATEGFIRQILGWREYVRGVYWLLMPEYAGRNALGADQPLPDFYWTGDTPLTCLRQSLSQTLRYGYAHHIQRLMVTGLYALLIGVRPQLVHQWYLAIYVDAVEWVELPNTLGMSQYGDGGIMASKPYIASGKYIQRMSNYCASCPKDPALSIGPDACPFTTLYWDFLIQHQPQLRSNNRMAMQLKNLARLSPDSRAAIQLQAAQIREDPAQ